MTNTLESYFSQIANDILQSAEQIVNRVEEGISVITTGKLPSQDNVGSSTVDPIHSTADSRSYDNTEYDDEEFTDEEMEEILLHNPLPGMTEQVLGSIMGTHQVSFRIGVDLVIKFCLTKYLPSFSLIFLLMFNQSGPQTTWEHIQAFKSAITWTEPLIISILTFQAIMFISTIWVTRKDRSLTPRIILMVLIATTVRSAEYLNTICSRNWKQLATQNYFDKKGYFILIMICVPLLFDSLFMLLAFLREASTLLIQVKTKQIKMQRKQKQEQQQKQSVPETTTYCTKDEKPSKKDD